MYRYESKVDKCARPQEVTDSNSRRRKPVSHHPNCILLLVVLWVNC